MTRLAIVTHPYRRNQIKPQQSEVGQIILAQLLVTEVGVYHPDAAKRPAPQAIDGQIRQDDLMVVADDHVFDRAMAVDEHGNLTPDLSRQDRTETGQLGRHHGIIRNFPAIDVFKPPQLAWLESR